MTLTFLYPEDIEKQQGLFLPLIFNLFLPCGYVYLLSGFCKQLDLMHSNQGHKNDK